VTWNEGISSAPVVEKEVLVVSGKAFQDINPKDSVPDLQRRDVVYKIPCTACNNSYIGQTGRKLSQRLDERRHAVKQADFNTSALAKHAWMCDHAVDWTNVKVLSNPRDYTTCILEEAVIVCRRGTPEQRLWITPSRV